MEALSELRHISKHLAQRDRTAKSALVERRRKSGLTQSAIDGALGLPEGSTKELEAYDSDPRVSELRRYESLIRLVEQQPEVAADLLEGSSGRADGNTPRLRRKKPL